MHALRPSALTAIITAGSVSASIDIVYACSFHYFFNQVAPLRILQSIASGLQGSAAFQGGYASAALGLFAHYVILIVAAGLYYAASLRLRWLRERPWPAGLAFGLAIWLTMNYVVLPLSAAPKFKAAGGWVSGPTWPCISCCWGRASRCCCAARGAPRRQKTRSDSSRAECALEHLMDACAARAQ